MPTHERFHLVDTTLREGEQFAGARFDSARRIAIAEMLSEFGVEYLELSSPAASPQSARDLETIARRGLRPRILTHTRCHPADARLAVECGAQGVNLLLATSEPLRRASHRHELAAVVERAQAVIAELRRHPVEIRFSCEDSFRTPLPDLLAVYRAALEAGADRIGVADTVGIARPREVFALVGALRAELGCDIEFHGHNDTGLALANTYCAYEAGATHLDVTVLGIGERNGIAALGGMVARLAADDPALVARYDLPRLPQIDRAVAEMLGLAIPFNMPISAPGAFHHKAGLHTNAVLRDPRSYEVLDPAAFGRRRELAVAHRLVGWHAVAERARELGITLSEPAARAAAARIKALGDEHDLDETTVDELLYAYAE